MTMTRSLIAALLCSTALCAGAACGDSVLLYEVTRTPTAECDVLPQGLFCDPQLSPPSVEVYTLEVRGSRTFLVFDEDTWVAEGSDGERTATQLSLATKEPGPCTTTTTGSFTFTATDTALNGTLERSSVLQGPAACGETPRGLRTSATVSGARVVIP